MKPLTEEGRCDLEPGNREAACMKSPLISVHLLTCVGREALLAETIAG